jgi:hypothetical protein
MIDIEAKSPMIEIELNETVKDPPLKKDDLMVITGGGFIAGNLALFFREKALHEFVWWTRSRSVAGTCVLPVLKNRWTSGCPGRS